VVADDVVWLVGTHEWATGAAGSGRQTRKDPAAIGTGQCR
jgi:hypothetical protein